MAKTKSISLFYQITPTEVKPPEDSAIARKNDWVKEIQKGIQAEWKPLIMRVTYRLVNPEVEQQRKFFNGPVVDYYAVQSGEILSGDVPREVHNQYRETILSEVLGYEVQLIDRVERRRKSTGDFMETQHWHDFLETLRETLFEPNGYEFPDSEAFWEMQKKHGYDQAKRIALEGLQKRYAARHKTG